MLFDPVTYLFVRNRAKKNNLSSRDAFKAAMLGSVAGGGNAAAGVLIADRRIRNMARPQAIAPPAGPADCIESLLGEIRRFVSCIDKADLDDKTLAAWRDSIRQIVDKLKIEAGFKQKLKKQVDEACSKD